MLESGYPLRAALTPSQVVIWCNGVKHHAEDAWKIAREIENAQLPVDLIVQNVPVESEADLGFSVSAGVIARHPGLLDRLRPFARSVQIVVGFSKISVSGLLMQGAGEVLDHILEGLARSEINISMVSLSSSRLEFLVEEQVGVTALNAVEIALKTSFQPD